MVLLRGAYFANAAMLAGEFPKTKLIGREIAGKRMGLVGFGAIARDVAQHARAARHGRSSPTTLTSRPTIRSGRRRSGSSSTALLVDRRRHQHPSAADAGDARPDRHGCLRPHEARCRAGQRRARRRHGRGGAGRGAEGRQARRRGARRLRRGAAARRRKALRRRAEPDPDAAYRRQHGRIRTAASPGSWPSASWRRWRAGHDAALAGARPRPRSPRSSRRRAPRRPMRLPSPGRWSWPRPTG